MWGQWCYGLFINHKKVVDTCQQVGGVCALQQGMQRLLVAVGCL